MICVHLYCSLRWLANNLGHWFDTVLRPIFVVDRPHWTRQIVFVQPILSWQIEAVLVPFEGTHSGNVFAEAHADDKCDVPLCCDSVNPEQRGWLLLGSRCWHYWRHPRSVMRSGLKRSDSMTHFYLPQTTFPSLLATTALDPYQSVLLLQHLWYSFRPQFTITTPNQRVI